MSNTPSTNLNALVGRRYNLEIEKLISDINRDLGTKSLLKKFSDNLSLITVLLVTGLLFTTILRLDTSIEEVTEVESTNQTEEMNDLIIRELGVGDCFNFDIVQTEEVLGDEKINYTFNGKSFSSQLNVDIYNGQVISPFLNLKSKVNCTDYHFGQIVSKQVITRTDQSKLLFPGGNLGIVSNESCYLDEEGICSGVLVSEIIPFSPADVAGIKKGSVIKSINGWPTFAVEELLLALSSLSNEMLKKPVVLLLIQDDYVEQKIVNLENNITDLDSESSIVIESNKLCQKENWNWSPVFIDSLTSQTTEFPKYEFYSLPILNKDEIFNDSFTVYCGMYLLNTNTENWEKLEIDELLKKWNGNLIEKFQNQFFRTNNRESFLEYENFYTVKSFEDITMGDCTYYDENSLEEKMTDQLIPFYTDCSTFISSLVILSNLEFSVTKENLILESEEFNNFLYQQCRDSYLEYRFNPEIAFAVLSDFYNSFLEIIDKPLWSKNYWKADGDTLSVKCGFQSKEISYETGSPEVVGYSFFTNLLDQSSQTDSLTAGFEYCPENYFIGDGYYVQNNFIPFDGERLDTFILLPKWDKGEYPIDSFSLQVSSPRDSKVSIEILPYLRGDDFNLSVYSNKIYDYSLNFSIKDHTYLQEYESGVIPSIIVLEEDYEGPLTFTIRAYDEDGTSAWASCTTNIVKNPKGKVVTSYGKNAEIRNNTFGGSAQYSTELETEYSELDFPKITYLSIHGDTNNLYIDFDISDNIEPRSIFIDLLVCEFPNEPDCFRIHEDYTTPSYYKQRVHFLDEGKDYSLNYSVGGEKWDLNPLGTVLEYRNVPLSYDPCSKVDYDWSSKSRVDPIYSFDFSCVNDGVEKIAVIIDAITYQVILNSDEICEIVYNGFRFPQFKKDQPKGQNITFSSCLDSKYLQNVPISENGGLLGRRYILNYNFGEITNLDLYYGSPFYFIYP